MSGKKRSEVEAALNAASRAANNARIALAEADAKALKNLNKAISSNLAHAERAASGQASLPGYLTGAEVQAAKQAQSAASGALAEARNLRDLAAQAIQQADSLDRQASRAFQDAQGQLDSAQAALRAHSSSGYLNREWKMAEQARRAFEAAQRDAKAAQSARQRATSEAQAAVQATSRAASTGQQASRSVQATVAAASERKRREEEAKRLAEEALRKATSAVATAAADANGIPATDAKKFQPSAFDTLHRQLADAESALKRKDSAKASKAAANVSTAARSLRDQVAQARADFDRRHAEADASMTALEATLAGADASLVAEWSTAPSAYQDAAKAVREVRDAMKREDFQTATDKSRRANEALRAAMESGAECRAANERRTAIGSAVMEVLHEMNFDVSFEPGTRDQPMCISGQTADETGRGDFELELPLDGEVHFEVTADAGDSSCVAAVNQLQQKLEERGMTWQTTGWGHATETAAGGGKTRTVTTTQTHTQTKSKSTSI